ncbi:glutamate receptor 3.2 isoform X2 [Hevea brasiliensis]|uniref:glutamate receptor 3.2 isoform X2 n=1 Tax=Hevea brasiliensis TaxID=3981 RepID=UPI0025D550F1|nr:glutamate receptor 3.2 isoform X2 [Hevea brasiliensis]XP_058010476.1 glutamate receptor 3.2 isoform X2 [Hevea brasiliensis]
MVCPPFFSSSLQTIFAEQEQEQHFVDPNSKELKKIRCMQGGLSTAQQGRDFFNSVKSSTTASLPNGFHFRRLENHAYNSVHNDFQANARSLIPLALSMKHANEHKESAFGKKQLNNKFHGQNFPISRGKLLKIGVPMRSTLKQFVEVSPDEKNIRGFSIDVFEAAVRLLPYKLRYKMVPFNGSNDDLLKEVSLKTLDAAAGDIVINAEGYQLVEFSQPYVEAGLTMLVKARTNKSQAWFFISPFTPWMWFTMAAMSMFTGFVIWLIEKENHEENGGSPASPIKTVLWISFATLYSGQRETPKNSLSIFVLAPWLFLLLVVSSTFTATLTSVLSNPHSEPFTAADVDVLKRMDAMIGCDGSSLIVQYLVKVIRFKPQNIKTIASSDDYAKALASGDIKAAFILMPHAKVFLGKYCSGFTISGPTYKLGGFGFVFQKGYSLASDMSQAIYRLSESGELQRMEEDMLSSNNCSVSLSDANVTSSLGPEPFLGLFIMSGGASTIALLITLICLLRRHWDSIINIQAAFAGIKLVHCWLTENR